MRRLPAAAVGVLLACLALLGSGGTAPAAAQPRGSAAELTDKERTLQQKQRQLREERARAAEARRREASLLGELEEADKRLAAARRTVAQLDGRIRRAQAEVSSLRAEVRRLEGQRATQEQGLGRRLRVLYKLTVQGGALPLALAGGDPVAQAVRLRHLATLAAVDARTITEYRVTSRELAERQRRVERRTAELGDLRAEADREREAVDREAARRRVLLARVRDERAYHERMVVELSEATRRLEALIRDLQARQRRVAKAPPAERPRPAPGEPGAGPGLAALRGRLTWPVDGRVVGEFGAQVHPRFGTRTFRNGIDIAVPEGTQIAAVAPGHVMYTGWFRGYGNLIIVDHGGEYYTLYAHAAEILVAEGDDVRQGQVIGTVGDTGSLQGPRLYFEVRHQGKPQDPTQWLRPRG
jgi:septal ring factor EnvC (AmiA/AmiB activator)